MRGEPLGICSQEPAETVLQTRILFNDRDEARSSKLDLIQLDPIGELFRVVKIRGPADNNLTLIPADSQFAMRLLQRPRVASEVITYMPH
jgi:hypothetical protein